MGARATTRIADITRTLDNREKSSTLQILAGYSRTSDYTDDFIQEVTNGSGAFSFDSSASGRNMNVTAAADYCIMKSYQSHRYIEGNSTVAQFTFERAQAQAGVLKRIGLFTSNNITPFDSALDGIFLEIDGDGLTAADQHSFCIYRNNTLVKRIKRDEWTNPLDGTVNGKTLNFENFTVMQIEYLWLGGAAVRFSFIVDGELFVVATYSHVGQSGVMMSTPQLPLRAECRSVTNPGDFTFICAKIASEGPSGGSVGEATAVNNNGSFVNANVTGTRYGLMGLRLKSTRLDAIVEAIGVSVACLTSDSVTWELRKNATIAAGTWGQNWTDRSANSSIQVAWGTSANAPTINNDGILVASGSVVADGDQAISVNNLRKLGSLLNQTPEELILVAIPVSTAGTPNLDIHGTINIADFH